MQIRILNFGPRKQRRQQMAKLTQDMKDVMEKSRGYAVATCDKDGVPNVVPIHFVKILSDDEIMMADIFQDRDIRQDLRHGG
jgi:predicted pyridoxine 5'-phosphate oxidase superfamily flavin-nucleotide-binding protein